MSVDFEPDRHPEESDSALRACRLYLALGPGRTLERVRAELGCKTVRHLEKWSSIFGWVQRARACDESYAQAEAIARRKALEADAKEWAARRHRQRESDWQIAQALRSKCVQILKKSIDDPDVRWTLADATKFARMAADLGRLAAGMETENVVVSGPGGGPIRVDQTPSAAHVAEVLAALDEAGALGCIGLGRIQEAEGPPGP